MTVSLRDGSGKVAEFDLGSDGSKTRAMDRIHDFALTEDGSRAYVAAGLHLRCLDLLKGRELWRYRPANVLGFIQSSPRAVAVTKGKNVLLCSDNGTMEVFRPDGVPVAKWRAGDSPLMLSRLGGSDTFVGSDGIGVSVWDADDRARLFRFRTTARVYALCAFPSGKRVAVRSDHGVSVLDLFNGQIVRTFPVLPGLPTIEVSPDGERIMVGEGRGVAFYTADGARIGSQAIEGERILASTYRKSDGAVFVGTDSGRVTIL